MGNILNPTRENSFETLVNFKDKDIFIDKTDFIAITNNRLNGNNRFIAVSRPRRFGKTVTAHMLLAYYSKEYAGKNIFDNLKISNEKSYAEHLNKYDVIYIDMNSIEWLFDDYSNKKQKIEAIDDIVDFLQYKVIQDLKENKEYAEQISSDPLIGKKSLSSALDVICKHTGKQFIFIMDECDLIFREYQNELALQKKFIKFLCGLFKSDSGKACFALAYLTGILPIKKYNSESTLNGFDEYNMLYPGNYASYFGFTEEDVTNIVKSPNCKVSLRDLKEWYKGYKIKGVDIYNPYSVVLAVQDGKCKNYWSRTSSNEEVVRLINMDFHGIKEDIIHLIEGEEVTFSCINFQNDLVNIKNKNDVFSLLVCIGYLGCSETKNPYRKVAYVPNAEIKSVLMSIVKEQNWYERMETIKRSLK